MTIIPFDIKENSRHPSSDAILLLPLDTEYFDIKAEAVAQKQWRRSSGAEAVAQKQWRRSSGAEAVAQKQ